MTQPQTQRAGAYPWQLVREWAQVMSPMLAGAKNSNANMSWLQSQRQKIQADRYKPLLSCIPAHATLRQANAGLPQDDCLRPAYRRRGQSPAEPSPEDQQVLQKTSRSLAAGIRWRLPRHKQLRALKIQDVTLQRYFTQVETFKSFCLRRRMRCSTIASVDKHICRSA